jgi:aminoglycoside phosphotransferase (APT) family kinase protein
VLSAWDRAADHLASLPRTLVHGEPYASNVLVDDDGRVAVVDWETTAIGTGWTDLAALAMGWPDAARSELLQAYLGVLGHDLLPADPVATLEAARLQLCLQWLGTDESWRAPVEHHRDWHADAVAIITGPSWPW